MLWQLKDCKQKVISFALIMNKSTGSLQFILNEPRNPKNIGASARGMANFGFRNLGVVNPYEKAWRETKSAVKAHEVVTQAKKFKSLKQALQSCHLVVGTSAGSNRSHPFRWMPLTQLRKQVQAHLHKGHRVAIVFGSERSGLSNRDLGYCHFVVRIPTDPKCPSMNLAQAVAVVAHNLQQKSSPRTQATPYSETISVRNRERLIHQGSKAIRNAKLLKGWNKNQTEDHLRQALNRWELNKKDTALLHAIFSWMIKVKKLGRVGIEPT